MGKHVKKPRHHNFDFRVGKYICYYCNEPIDEKYQAPQQPVRASRYLCEAGGDRKLYLLHSNCVEACEEKWRREHREHESNASGSGNNAKTCNTNKHRHHHHLRRRHHRIRRRHHHHRIRHNHISLTMLAQFRCPHLHECPHFSVQSPSGVRSASLSVDHVGHFHVACLADRVGAT